MLIRREKSVNGVDVELRHARDVSQPGDDFIDSELSGELLHWVGSAVEEKGDVTVGGRVLVEEVDECRVASVAAELFVQYTAFVGAKSEETIVSLIVDVGRE